MTKPINYDALIAWAVGEWDNNTPPEGLATALLQAKAGQALAEALKAAMKALDYCAAGPGELSPVNQAQFMVARTALEPASKALAAWYETGGK